MVNIHHPSLAPGLTWRIGNECDTENDCDGDLTCRAGRCANPSGSVPSTTSRRPTSTRRPTTTPRPTPTPSAPCEWEGHCLGMSLSTALHPQLIQRLTHLPLRGYLCRRRRLRRRPGLSERTLRTTYRRRRGTNHDRHPHHGHAAATARDHWWMFRPLHRSVLLWSSDQIAANSCLGLSCATDADCGDGLLICRNGRCGL